MDITTQDHDGWIALSGEGFDLLVRGEESLRQRVESALEQSGEGDAESAVDVVLDELTVGGIRGTPDFVLVDAASGRVWVRGAAVAQVSSPEGEIAITGPVRGPWTEEDLPEDTTAVSLGSTESPAPVVSDAPVVGHESAVGDEPAVAVSEPAGPPATEPVTVGEEAASGQPPIERAEAVVPVEEVVDKPALDEPADEETADDGPGEPQPEDSEVAEPVAEEPAEPEPEAAEPVAEEPAEPEPEIAEPVAEEPAEPEPEVGEPVAEEPAAPAEPEPKPSEPAGSPAVTSAPASPGWSMPSVFGSRPQLRVVDDQPAAPAATPPADTPPADTPPADTPPTADRAGEAADQPVAETPAPQPSGQDDPTSPNAPTPAAADGTDGPGPFGSGALTPDPGPTGRSVPEPGSPDPGTPDADAPEPDEGSAAAAESLQPAGAEAQPAGAEASRGVPGDDRAGDEAPADGRRGDDPRTDSPPPDVRTHDDQDHGEDQDDELPSFDYLFGNTGQHRDSLTPEEEAAIDSGPVAAAGGFQAAEPAADATLAPPSEDDHHGASDHAAPGEASGVPPMPSSSPEDSRPQDSHPDESKAHDSKAHDSNAHNSRDARDAAASAPSGALAGDGSGPDLVAGHSLPGAGDGPSGVSAARDGAAPGAARPQRPQFSADGHLVGRRLPTPAPEEAPAAPGSDGVIAAVPWGQAASNAGTPAGQSPDSRARSADHTAAPEAGGDQAGAGQVLPFGGAPAGLPSFGGNPSGPAAHEPDQSSQPAREPDHRGPMVLAVSCARGHLSAPHATRCRVCHDQLPEQQPQQVVRPALGALRLSNGDVVTLDRGVLLGRAPKSAPDLGAAQPHLVRVASPDNELSRNHAEIILDGWHVLIRDLGSTNGTTVALPGSSPVRVRPGDQQSIEPGTTITLAEQVSMVFEVTG